MNKLNLALIIIAAALIALGRRGATQQHDRQTVAATPNLQLRPASLQAAADARPHGGIDKGMVVPSPYNGDPKMSVNVPFKGDEGMIRRPDTKD